jgi:Zn-dependent protease with chaperone function
MVEPLFALAALVVLLAYPSGVEPLWFLRGGRDTTLVLGASIPSSILWTALLVALYGIWCAAHFARVSGAAEGGGLARRRFVARIVAVAAYAASVYILHFPSAVQIQASVTASVLLGLAPYFAMAGLSGLLGSLREGILEPGEPVRAKLEFGLQSFVGFSLAPLLGILLLLEVFSQYEPLGQLAYVYPFVVWGSFLLLVLAVIMISPYLLRVLFAAAPLEPGPLRDRLEAFCRRAGFVAGELLVIPSSRIRFANAFIVGLLPRMRFVFFTDYLIDGLKPEHVECVLAHEIAHAKRSHLPALFFFGVGSLILANFVIETVSFTFSGDSPWLFALLPVLLYAWVGSFSFISRRFESEADLWGAEMHGDPSAFVETLKRIAELNRVPPERGSLRHFSIADRIQMILSARMVPMYSEYIYAIARTIRKVCFYGFVMMVAMLLPIFVRQVKWDHVRLEIYQAMIRVDEGRAMVERLQFAAAEPVLISAIETLDDAGVERETLARARLYLARAQAELGRHREARRQLDKAQALGLRTPHDRLLLLKLAAGYEP